MKRTARVWIISLGGLGLLPAMPGTYASLAAAFLFYLVWAVLGSWTWVPISGLALVAGILSGALCPWAERHFKTRDPRQFVLDELVGQWLTLLLIPLHTHPLSGIAAGFFLFRAMDVAKPYPIKKIEQLPSGWGLVLDDVAAAVYAAVGVRLLILASGALLGPGR